MKTLNKRYIDALYKLGWDVNYDENGKVGLTAYTPVYSDPFYLLANIYNFTNDIIEYYDMFDVDEYAAILFIIEYKRSAGEGPYYVREYVEEAEKTKKMLDELRAEMCEIRRNIADANEDDFYEIPA